MRQVGFTTSVKPEMLAWIDKLADEYSTTRSEIVRQLIKTAQLNKEFLKKSLERL